MRSMSCSEPERKATVHRRVLWLPRTGQFQQDPPTPATHFGAMRPVPCSTRLNRQSSFDPAQRQGLRALSQCAQSVVTLAGYQEREDRHLRVLRTCEGHSSLVKEEFSIIGRPEVNVRNADDGENSSSNRSAIGAWGVCQSQSRRQASWVSNSVGYTSSSDLRVHFGVGQDQLAGEIEIRWPSG